MSRFQLAAERVETPVGLGAEVVDAPPQPEEEGDDDRGSDEFGQFHAMPP